MEDVIATQRAQDFITCWFLDPLIYGDYPEIMKKNAGTRIPTFTKLESRQVKGSFDFLGLNHYTTIQVKDMSIDLEMDVRDLAADMAVQLIFPRKCSRGSETTSELCQAQVWEAPIYIHENGQSTLRNGTLKDTPRVEFIQAFIGSLLDALRNGSNTRGYFSWSFLDVFELLDDKDLKRYPKLSAHWYSNFLRGRSISLDKVNQVVRSMSDFSQSQFSK